MLRVTQQWAVLSCSSTETRVCQLMSVSDWPVVCWQFRQLIENSLSEMAEGAGIPKYFSASCTSLGYLVPLPFHHIKGLVLMSTGGISEYIITSSDCCCWRVFWKDDGNIFAAVGPLPKRAFLQPDSYSTGVLGDSIKRHRQSQSGVRRHRTSKYATLSRPRLHDTGIPNLKLSMTSRLREIQAGIERYPGFRVPVPSIVCVFVCVSDQDEYILIPITAYLDFWRRASPSRAIYTTNRHLAVKNQGYRSGF